MAAAEICEDLWVTLPPSVLHAQAGANLIVNLSASNEMVERTATAEILFPDSLHVWCADMYMQMQEKVSPHRIWSLAVRI